MKIITESIIEGGNEKECWFCQSQTALHRHHIFFGTAKRTISEKYGCWCYLCFEHHEGTYGVHGKHGHDRDLTLKRVAQRAWEKKYGTRETFRAVFGRSYLEESDPAIKEGCDGC